MCIVLAYAQRTHLSTAVLWAYKTNMHLADYMRLKELTDEEVARRVSKTRPTISRIRRKISRPDWDLIAKLNRMSRGAITANDFAELENG